MLYMYRPNESKDSLLPVLVKDVTRNTSRRRGTRYALRFQLRFTKTLFYKDFLPVTNVRGSKEVISERRTEQTEQACNNTSFSPDWITIISCEIESLIARIPYDDDQLAPARKQE